MFRKLIFYTRTLLSDAIKVIKGFFSLAGHTFSKESIPLSLSLFLSNTFKTKVGEPCSYKLEVVNHCSTPQWVRILINIYRHGSWNKGYGHFGYFEKRVFLQAFNSQRVDVIHNWEELAVFLIDNVTFEPDNSWRGHIAAEGKFTIDAVLYDDKGGFIEQLILIQEIIP